MNYKEKPILKLYKYENDSFVLQAQIDDYQEFSFENNLYQAGRFSITINHNIPNANLFKKGLFLQFGNNKFGEISKIQDSIGEDGKGSQYRIITGLDIRYILKRRVIKNLNSNGLWEMTAKGELVIRNLIQDQCGINAEQKRRLPIINNIPQVQDAIGKEVSISESFTNLYEVCKTIATQSEIGWWIDFDDGDLTLRFFNGTDRSETVRFDTNFESLANGEFVDTSESFTNAIYIGGKGQNDDRDIYEGENAIEGDSPAGFDRFESWDNQSSMTTEDEYEAEANSMLVQYGQTLEMNGNGLAKCPYEYEKEYFVGDFITVSFSGKSAVAQILSITEHWSFANYDIQFQFGKPQNDLSDQLQLILKQIQRASNKTNSTESVRWYTIPTDSEMPRADVTYNTIGFTGNCGPNGFTFKFYLDDEKTGSKTYHIYCKQLTGGKLTLTTDKDKTDLIMNSGNYVGIIYIDEEGNITNQGMGTTPSVEDGNLQPPTSDAVYEAIQDISGTDIEVYPSEQAIIDDLANLEVGDIVASDDPNENETIAILMAKIQELEEKINKYYQPSSINWQNSNGGTTVTLTFNETLPAGLYEIYLGGSIVYHTTTNFHTCNDTPYGATMKVNTDGASYTGCTGLWKTNTSFSTLVIKGYATQGSSDSGSNNKPSAGTEMCYVKKIGE